jgi:hypothetical protein
LARAQQGGRGRRIVALMSMAADDPEAQPRVAAFESGLRELGWLDGRNLRIEYHRVSDGDLLRGNAAELARMPPDLILATSTPVMAALREQGLTISTTCFRRSLWAGWEKRRKSLPSWLGWGRKNARSARAPSSISPAVDRLIEQPNSSASKQSMDDAIAGFAAPRAGSWVG